MKAIENWVKDIVFYMIFVTMVMNLLPDPKYEKYLRLFAGAAYRPRLLVFSRAVHLVLLQLLVRVCAHLLPGSVTACSTLAARVLPVFRLPPDAAAAGFVFLCAALYKARQSLYNK